MIALTNTICEISDTTVVVFSDRTPHAIEHKSIAVYSFQTFYEAIAFVNFQKDRPEVTGIVVQSVDGITLHGTTCDGKPLGRLFTKSA